MGLLDTLIQICGLRRTAVTLDGPAAPGTAEAAVQRLIARLRQLPNSEIREDSTHIYLEMVITGHQLDNYATVLTEVLGPPVKPFGESVSLEKPLRAMVDSQGGIRRDQCLYLKHYQDQFVAFAALWPWSGGNPLTLKVGVFSQPLP